MINNSQTDGPGYSGNFSKSTTTGAGAGGGGLASMAQAFASACGSGSIVGLGQPGAGARVLGVEAMTVGEALASRELASAPMMRAIQLALDERIIQRSAYKLRARMEADGRTVAADELAEAIQAARVAVVMWREGVTITREDGADVMGAGDDFERHIARVAWRALVAAFSADSVGITLQIQGGAEDDWLCAQALPSESRTERAARRLVERHAGKRQALLGRRLMAIERGRGRRAQAIGKVGQALGALLDGYPLDEAAKVAGFNVRGRHPAGDGLIRAASRLGLIPEGFTIPRRGR